MGTLLSLRSKLVNRLMNIPYDTKESGLQAEMKRLVKEIELVNRKISSL
jgi:hypothetical protein